MPRFSRVFALVIFVTDIIIISALPSASSDQLLGYEYWNTRCAMQYSHDWLGFWNNWNNGQTEYKRKNNYQYMNCPGQCDCSKQELDCRQHSKGELTARKLSMKVNVIRNGHLPAGLEEIKLINIGLSQIEGEVFHNLTNLKILELGKNKLKVMPDVSLNRNLEKLILDDNEIEIFIENVTALPKSLTKLVLLKNKIKFIPDKMFNLPNLQRVSLSYNKLTRFPDFYNAKKLEFVSVDQNEIKSITYTNLEAFFGNNSFLKHLNLSNNHITYIPPQALSNLIHLKILEVHVNNISTIDAQVFYQIPELCYLDLRKNKIEILTTLGYTPVFEDLPKLKTLILTGQSPKTKAIMYNAFKSLPKLQHLWLNDNLLEHFPNPALSQEEWPSIKDLHIERNSLTTFTSYSSTDFPPDMMVLWSMVHHNVFNKIEEDDLWELDNLRQLYLSSNSLTEQTIHQEAFRNMLLRKLHLDRMNGIGIQYVPSVAKMKSRLPNVTEIDLSSNKLTFLLNGSFSSLDTLSLLNLGDNAIVSAETGSFPENINTIDMNSNHFDFRHPDVFANLHSLTTLHLGENKIGRILKEAFKGLKKLSWLDVSNNELSYIEEGTFTAIDRSSSPIVSINLRNNHLTLLPAQGDFNGLTLTNLQVDNNRLTRIRSKTFENLKCGSSHSNWDFRNNDIVELEEDSFVNITGSDGCSLLISGGLRKNPLKRIASRAFNNVKAREIFLNDLELTTLYYETFKNIKLTYDLELQGNAIESIEAGAFNTVTARYLYLQDNKIKDISGKIFGSGSQVHDL